MPGVGSAAQLEADLRFGLNHVRRQKDAVELARMRAAERATRDGFAQVASLIEPGRSERELQIELEAAFFRGGADFLAFDTIVAGGPNSAVLHFPPTSRRLADGELILIDAGAEYRGYASDITRTYPASGGFTPEQQEVYEIVAVALARATERCTAGTEWRDVHRTAALVIAEGMVGLGLLRGQPESLVERGPRLRVDMPLQPGHVFTVEPGIYFVPALLEDPDLRERHRDAVDWDRAEAMLGFGGIRIENNVLITDDGNEVLTADVPLLA